jgi:hypothetical protein
MVTPSHQSEICHVLSILDGVTEEVVDVHEIHPFDLPAFRHQFDVPVESDPEMLDRYAVGPDDAIFLNGALGIELPFDFSRFAYFIEAARKDV